MLDEILWQQNKHLAEACLHHPFVRGLADGTLYPEAFRRYVAQDAYFLNAFARAYALAAARSQEETLISLCKLLNGVLRELQLHAGYAKELKIDLACVQPYRQVTAYTDFLLATAWHGEPGETIAARLRALGFRWSKVLRHWEGLAAFEAASRAADELGGTLRRVTADAASAGEIGGSGDVTRAAE